jgi:hypothetical protein
VGVVGQYSRSWRDLNLVVFIFLCDHPWDPWNLPASSSIQISLTGVHGRPERCLSLSSLSPLTKRTVLTSTVWSPYTFIKRRWMSTDVIFPHAGIQWHASAK